MLIFIALTSKTKEIIIFNCVSYSKLLLKADKVYKVALCSSHEPDTF